MITKIISFQHTVDGALTDVDAVMFSDPSGSFGLRCMDTGQVVLGDSTPLNRDDVGRYSYTAASLTAGAAYEYWLEWIFRGESRRLQRSFIAGVTKAQGNYHDEDDVNDLGGVEWVRLASNQGNATGAADTARMQRAIDWAESQVNARLSRLYVVPMTLGGDDARQVRNVCARLSLWWLSQNRQVGTDVKNLVERMDAHKQIADVQIGRWATGVDQLDAVKR